MNDRSHPAADPTPWDSTETCKRMHALPGFGRAWEYARRNRVLQKNWQDSAAHFEITTIGPKTRLIVR